MFRKDNSYEQIIEAFPEFAQKHSFKDWLQARISQASRTFSDSKEGETRIKVPLGELFNHSEDPHLEWKFVNNEDGSRAFTFRATRNITKGEEVTISYGLKNNFELLAVYGFYIPGNANPLIIKVNLPMITIRRSDKLFQIKEELYGNGSAEVSVDFGSASAAKLRQRLRFL